MGPVVNRFGCRAVAISCVLVCAASTFIAAFVRDTFSLFAFYGVGSGESLNSLIARVT
jgi:hypothetical protein